MGASVSKALCWIDYAMSCHYGAATGDYNSYNGYTSNVCQEWMDSKIADLERKRDGAGKYGRIFEAQINGFRQCTVNWEAPSAPLVDISSFERKPDTRYTNTETKGQQVDAYADTKGEQITDTYADTKTKADQTDGYVDPNAIPVKIPDQSYTDDNAKIVASNDANNYEEDLSADIVEEAPKQRNHIEYSQHQYFKHCINKSCDNY